MIVVDSSVWIDWFKDSNGAGARALDRMVDTDQVIVGDLVLVELLEGARHDLHAAKIERFLRRFQHVSLCNPELAVKAASNYRRLRSAGLTIRKTPDLIIATFCIENGHELLQSDRDFTPFERHFGLRLIKP